MTYIEFGPWTTGSESYPAYGELEENPTDGERVDPAYGVLVGKPFHWGSAEDNGNLGGEEKAVYILSLTRCLSIIGLSKKRSVF